MADTAPITLGGLSSGMDTSAMVTALVSASSTQLNAFQARSTESKAAVASLSTTGKLLSTLQTAAAALSSTIDVGSFKASSDNAIIVPSALPTALPGSYQLTVSSLAKEQRTYSQQFATRDTGLGMTGSLKLQVGTTGTEKSIDIASTDSLDTVASKINGMGIRAQASIFYDGTKYRLQVRGLDTGVANKLNFTETGTTFDLNGTGATSSSGKTVQAASDLAANIDGFAVSSSNNQLSGVIPGVSLAVSNTSSTPVTVTVASDSATVATKLKTFVDAFNSVVSNIHTTAGYGSSSASNSLLAGDSSLRGVNQKLVSAVQATYANTGTFTRLSDIGVTLAKDGMLQIDDKKFADAFTSNPNSVVQLLGRPVSATSGGMMANIRDSLRTLNAAGTGLVDSRKSSLQSQANRLDKRVTTEQDRLDKYAAQLRTQFAAMETAYSKNQNLMGQLSSLNTTTTRG